MAKRIRPPTQSGSPRGGRTAFGLRPVAIGLMIAGVVGFIVARVVFGEQVLCLLGSTLVTFTGLAMIVAARKYGWGQSTRSAQPPSSHTQVPMADPAYDWMEQLGQRQSRLPPLADRAAIIFRQQGAQVTVEARREDRSILRIETREGERYIAMILETDAPVDTAEVRGLNALISGGADQRIDGGILINSSGFTLRAVQWAQGKPIRLVEASQLSDLNV